MPRAPDRPTPMALHRRTGGRQRAGAVAILILALGAAACGRAGSPAGGSGGGSECSAPPIVVGDAANGRTVQACVGQTIRLELASTYWQDVSSSDEAVLAADGPSSVAPASPGTCVPGGGCGSVERTFQASASGTATVSAHRTTCGEALQCSTDQRTFSVRIVVS